MKKAILFLLLLVPIVAFSQSKESKQTNDSLNKENLQPTTQNNYKAELAMANRNEQMAALYNHAGHHDEAIKLETEVVNIRKKALGEEHTDYAKALNLLACFYNNIDNNTEAIKLENIAVRIYQKKLGEEHPDYLNSLNNLGFFYSSIGNYTESIKLRTKEVEITKKVLGENNTNYTILLNNLANDYCQIYNYTEAIRLQTKAVEIIKNNLGEQHQNYTLALSNLASYNTKLGNYDEAIRLGTIALEIQKKVLGEEHPDYATSLSILATNNERLGNYVEAIRLETLAMDIKKKALGEDHPGYFTLFNSLAAYYSKLGNYTEAIRLGTLAMEISKKKLGEQHPFYATTVDNLAQYYAYIHNYTEAIRLGSIAMNIFKQVLGEEDIDYAVSLINLAANYNKIGNYTEGLRLGNNALEIFKKVLGEEHFLCADALCNIANCYSYLSNYTEAIKFETKGMIIYKKVFGVGHPKYIYSLFKLAEFNRNIGNFDKAIDYYQQCYYQLNSYILKSFASMTPKERSDFWKTYSNLFTNKMSFVAYQHPDTTLTALAYNGQVLSKGLLLNTELEIQKLIEQSKDTAFVNRYYSIKQNRILLDKLYKTSLANRKMDVDSLAKVIDKEEHFLVQSSKELGDFTKNLSITWQDIQKKLKDNDIAIEFASIKDTATKQFAYIALLLKKGMLAPELIKIDFTDNDAVDYTTSSLYNKIWKPLENRLQGVDNVYFSPTGKFHNIGIEYLPDENGEIFAKKYNAYRLSSTRELVIEKIHNPNKKASVYGGIVYNFTQDDWQNVSEDAERAGITFLKGAKKESEEITNILSENSFNVSYGTDKAATEESFKKLSGSGIKILHIATHGFYEPESKENSFADLLAGDDENSQEDLSLSRSGLFLAGASSGLDPEQRKYIPDGVDDGILTAKEISRMDFKGLDLVVLSACQTGLGEVTSEGVFGLQRGFKKAGAQTIVMSLWNVSDKPTRELMTEFYRNLVAGKSKREAFILAQDKIRLKYIDPKMWAGFIMVDGIE